METSKNSPIRAAQYVRMSTENQQYSIDNQRDVISHYAQQHNMEIVRTYNDAAKSGLTMASRPALRQLIDDVESGSAGFSAILVYDVSRWGRFQDADESAYYEYRCRRANITVHYCAEPFANDGTPYTALVKTIKRMMAAEYSRELSAKVFAGQSRLTELGFRQGGTAGYGFRRMLVDHQGKPKFVLACGEEKSIATDRVVLVPGPKEEIAVVNEVFRLYADERLSTTVIAEMLNQRGIACENGSKWTRSIIRRMVTNPKYIGANVTNRQSAKLRSRVVQNPPEMWIRRDNAFPAIVDRSLYEKAVRESAFRSHNITDKELLDLLRQFVHDHGKATERLIRKDPDMPCAQIYNQRFGGLVEAYKLIGYRPRRNLDYINRDRNLVQIRRTFIAAVVNRLVELGASVQQDARTKLVYVNRDLKMRLCLSPRSARSRVLCWKLPLYSPLKPDVTVFARLTPNNQAILDYLYLPWSDKAPSQITIREEDDGAICSIRLPGVIEFDHARFTDLTFLKDVLARRKISATGQKR